MPDPERMDVTNPDLGLLGLAHADRVPYQLKGEIRFGADALDQAVESDEAMRSFGNLIADEMLRTWTRDLVEFRERLRLTVQAMERGDPMLQIFLSIPTRAPGVAPVPDLTERLRELLIVDHDNLAGEFGKCDGAPKCGVCQAIADASPKGVA